MPKPTKVPLLVTTEHKGVFFGYGVMGETKTITLESARMCVYWSADCHGILGLAANGPTKNCKVTPAVYELALTEVTSISAISAEAAKAWESEPWN